MQHELIKALKKTVKGIDEHTAVEAINMSRKTLGHLLGVRADTDTPFFVGDWPVKFKNIKAGKAEVSLKAKNTIVTEITIFDA